MKKDDLAASSDSSLLYEILVLSVALFGPAATNCLFVYIVPPDRFLLTAGLGGDCFISVYLHSDSSFFTSFI